MKSSEIKPYRRKAYYYETDKMGIVHHSNYIRWLEEARVHMLTEVGYPFEKIEAEGLYMPVLSVECHYKYPVRFDEQFEIHPVVTRFNGCKLTVEYKVINLSADGQISVIGKSEHCFTDHNMKPIRVKKEHPEIFKVFDDAVEEFKI